MLDLRKASRSGLFTSSFPCMCTLAAKSPSAKGSSQHSDCGKEFSARLSRLYGMETFSDF